MEIEVLSWVEGLGFMGRGLWFRGQGLWFRGLGFR